MADARDKFTRSKPWSLPASLALIAVGMPILFYVQFGYVDGYTWGVTGFLMLLVGGIELTLRYNAKHPNEKPPAYKKSRFDVLGVVWLLCIPFAPLLGWVLTGALEVDAENWRWLVGGRAAVCVVLPLVCVLPLIRFVRRPHAAFMIGVLVVGTGFPVLTGVAAVVDTVRGPRWEAVEVERFEDIEFRTRSGTHVRRPRAFVHLSDGRRLTRCPGVEFGRGPNTLQILGGIERVIGVRGP